MKIIKRITFLLFILSVIVFLDLAHNYFNGKRQILRLG